MKGVMKYQDGPGHVELREIPEPTPGPGQIKIRVEYAGICGSDLHIYDSNIAITTRPPVVIGHEFSGGRGRRGRHGLQARRPHRG